MAGLADALRMRFPMQPQMQDPMMPVPQQSVPFGLAPQIQHPLHTQEHTGFMSPGLAEFMRDYFNQRRL